MENRDKNKTNKTTHNSSSNIYSFKESVVLFKQLLRETRQYKRAVIYPTLSLCFGLAVSFLVSLLAQPSNSKGTLGDALKGNLVEPADIAQFAPVAAGLMLAVIVAGMINLALYLDWAGYWSKQPQTIKHNIRLAFSRTPTILFWYALLLAMFVGIQSVELTLMAWIITLFVEPLIVVKGLSLVNAISVSAKIAFRQWKLVMVCIFGQFLFTNMLAVVTPLLATLPKPISSISLFLMYIVFFVYLMVFQSAWRMAIMIVDEQKNRQVRVGKDEQGDGQNNQDTNITEQAF